jgi:RNA polymerase sigma-70 factor (ECF subfamily)
MSHFNKNNVIVSAEEVIALVKKAKAGDQVAWHTLYDLYFTPLYRYVFIRLGDTHKTEDVVQTVFLRWFASIDTFTVYDSPLQYLFVIARRVMIDEFRKEKRDTSLSLDEAMESGTEVADAHDVVYELDKEISKEILLETIKLLGHLEQEVLTLSFFGEQSTKEIAQILGQEEANVRQIKSRALRRLATHLKNHHELT